MNMSGECEAKWAVVPEFAQGCRGWLEDSRLVLTRDSRLWYPSNSEDDVVTDWTQWGDDYATRSTEEIAAMGGQLLAAPDGRAVSSVGSDSTGVGLTVGDETLGRGH